MKKAISLTVLSILAVSSLACCIYLYSKCKAYRSEISLLKDQITFMSGQIKTRNEVIDKSLGINLADPLSLAPNYKGLHQGIHILSDEECKEAKLPLYAPDGHYFGIISFAAYSAITQGQIGTYKCLNDEELQALNSYMNYVSLCPGMSLVKYH